MEYPVRSCVLFRWCSWLSQITGLAFVSASASSVGLKIATRPRAMCVFVALWRMNGLGRTDGPLQSWVSLRPKCREANAWSGPCVVVGSDTVSVNRLNAWIMQSCKPRQNKKKKHCCTTIVLDAWALFWRLCFSYHQSHCFCLLL